jgi:hypothetical protein
MGARLEDQLNGTDASLTALYVDRTGSRYYGTVLCPYGVELRYHSAHHIRMHLGTQYPSSGFCARKMRG